MNDMNLKERQDVCLKAIEAIEGAASVKDRNVFIPHQPLRPNQCYGGGIIIASGHHSDEFMAYLLLMPEAPYYRIIEVEIATDEITEIATHENIIPAVTGHYDVSGDQLLPMMYQKDKPQLAMGFGEYGFWGEL
jgi:hypothetical protein